LKRLKRVPDSRPVLRSALRRGLWAIVFLVLAAACALTFLVFFTGVFKIKEVNFTGNQNVSTDRLKQASGIEAYSNLVTLPVGRIARDLETNSWVKHARVQRHLPHTVNIQIVERVPVAMLDYTTSAYLVGSDGLVIEKIAPDQHPELPRVYGGKSTQPTVGSRVSDKKLDECVEVLAGMPKAVRDMLLLGNPFDGRGQVFVSRSGFNVIYGHTGSMRKKNEVLEAIITEVNNNKRKIAYVDVRVPDSPVIKPQ